MHDGTIHSSITLVLADENPVRFGFGRTNRPEPFRRFLTVVLVRCQAAPAAGSGAAGATADAEEHSVQL